MELLLIRHGLPVRIDQSEGPADPGLAPSGRQQAEALAAWLAGEGVDAVYSSPLRRAVETAAPLADRLGLEPTVVDGLAEFDRESPYYVPMEELWGTDDPRLADLVRDWTAPETAPQREQFRTTVVDAVEPIVAAHPGGKAVAVCHGGVVNAYLSHVIGVANPMFFEPDYTSISRVLASRSGARQLVSANETGHLRRPFA
jgi:probable phosphoglycerate mutase